MKENKKKEEEPKPLTKAEEKKFVEKWDKVEY